ncbi:MAG: hypothetical protein ACU85V_02965 [Gammaproteobacteria bacterium]
MATQELHISATTGWRALLTHAQYAAGLELAPEVEEYLVSLLFRYVGMETGPTEYGRGFLDRFDRIMQADADKPTAVGDQCLILAGLVPEHAISKGLPVSYFVEVGRNAYREFASQHRSTVYGMLAETFVRCMDTLQTLRVMQSGEPCIDGFNAFSLWHDLGSAHGWQVLRSLTPSLPASCSVSDSVH